MGRSREPRDFTLPDNLVTKAVGVRLVTAKYPGAGRAAKIARAGARDAFEQMEDVGPRAQDMLDRHEAKRADQKKKLSPEKFALVRYPPMVVCARCITHLDGDSVTRDDVETWLEDVHVDVPKFIALELLNWGELVEETEDASGEDSGGSP